MSPGKFLNLAWSRGLTFFSKSLLEFYIAVELASHCYYGIDALCNIAYVDRDVNSKLAGQLLVRVIPES